MNWQVAEAAMFHGGGASGCCEDEMEAERAAYQEHLRRQKKEKAAQNKVVHSDASVAMQAEHRKMQQQERERQAERVEAERRENAESTLLVGSSYGLPPELSSQILDRVGSVLTGNVGSNRRNSGGQLGQGYGDARFTRTFRYAGTQQALTEAEHAHRERLRQGVAAFERRADRYVTEMASPASQEARWEHMQAVSAEQAKKMVDRGNRLHHGIEDKKFVDQWRS